MDMEKVIRTSLLRFLRMRSETNGLRSREEAWAIHLGPVNP